jgi:hypothetical protein
MFIAHSNGHPVVIKTNRGAHFVAFGTLDDGKTFVRSRQAPFALGTLGDILRLNPTAFPRNFSVLHLPTRDAIDMFVRDPEGFPTAEYLVTLKNELVPPTSEQPAPSREGTGQDELKF